MIISNRILSDAKNQQTMNSTNVKHLNRRRFDNHIVQEDIK